jgi:penicillin amidase
MHLEARDEHDLCMAQGFVTAQDRLWQMEYQRRVSDGTLAELFGPDLVPIDLEFRTLGLKQAGSTTLGSLFFFPRTN